MRFVVRTKAVIMLPRITSTVWVLVFLSCCAAARAELLTGIVLREDGEPANGATVNAAAVFHSPPLRVSTTANEDAPFRSSSNR